jgi:antirestriction protein
MTKAKEFSLVNSLDETINQAYIDNVGEEYATAEQVEESYSGEYPSDTAFAQDMAEQWGLINKDLAWPYTCIDWDQASNELMYDYFESNGYYFRNL